MTLELFIIGIAICSAFTALFTEAVKKLIESGGGKANSNIIAAVCSIVVALAVVVIYAVMCEVTITAQFITVGILLTVFSWLGAMVGYDKIVQTIKQLTGKEE